MTSNGDTRPVWPRWVWFGLWWALTAFLTLNYFAVEDRAKQASSGDSASPRAASSGKLLSPDNVYAALHALNPTKQYDDTPETGSRQVPTVQAGQGPPTHDDLSRQNTDLSQQTLAIQKTLNARLHREQTSSESFLKIAAVVALSILWFLTFLVANDATRWWGRKRVKRAAPGARQGAGDGEHAAIWKELVPHPVKLLFIAFAVLPSVPFVIAMYHSYEPAVFVMALVAIFVAAEHYSGLTETEHELKSRTDELKGSMVKVLDADGLNQWRSDVYKLYGEAEQRIDAVLRYFDIDAEWWMAANADKPWEKYKELCGKNKEALWSVLQQNDVKVQFVGDIPLTCLPWQSGLPDELAKTEFFRNFLGLVWNLVVLEHLYRERLTRLRGPDEATPYLRVKLTRAPFWMHVVDDTVYQLIDRGQAAKSTVRELTFSMADLNSRKALSDWARNNVRQAAQRGGQAGEYVCSVLRYTALRMQGFANYDENAELPLADILRELGMDTWVLHPKEEFVVHTQNHVDPRANRVLALTSDSARRLCLAVFQEFLSLRFRTEHWTLTDLGADVL